MAVGTEKAQNKSKRAGANATRVDNHSVHNQQGVAHDEQAPPKKKRTLVGKVLGVLSMLTGVGKPEEKPITIFQRRLALLKGEAAPPAETREQQEEQYDVYMERMKELKELIAKDVPGAKRMREQLKDVVSKDVNMQLIAQERNRNASSAEKERITAETSRKTPIELDELNPTRNLVDLPDKIEGEGKAQGPLPYTYRAPNGASGKVNISGGAASNEGGSRMYEDGGARNLLVGDTTYNMAGDSNPKGKVRDTEGLDLPAPASKLSSGIDDLLGDNSIIPGHPVPPSQNTNTAKTAKPKETPVTTINRTTVPLDPNDNPEAQAGTGSTAKADEEIEFSLVDDEPKKPKSNAELAAAKALGIVSDEEIKKAEKILYETPRVEATPEFVEDLYRSNTPKDEAEPADVNLDDTFVNETAAVLSLAYKKLNPLAENAHEAFFINAQNELKTIFGPAKSHLLQADVNVLMLDFAKNKGVAGRQEFAIQLIPHSNITMPREAGDTRSRYEDVVQLYAQAIAATLNDSGVKCEYSHDDTNKNLVKFSVDTSKRLQCESVYGAVVDAVVALKKQYGNINEFYKRTMKLNYQLNQKTHANGVRYSTNILRVQGSIVGVDRDTGQFLLGLKSSHRNLTENTKFPDGVEPILNPIAEAIKAKHIDYDDEEVPGSKDTQYGARFVQVIKAKDAKGNLAIFQPDEDKNKNERDGMDGITWCAKNRQRQLNNGVEAKDKNIDALLAKLSANKRARRKVAKLAALHDLELEAITEQLARLDDKTVIKSAEDYHREKVEEYKGMLKKKEFQPYIKDNNKENGASLFLAAIDELENDKVYWDFADKTSVDTYLASRKYLDHFSTQVFREGLDVYVHDPKARAFAIKNNIFDEPNEKGKEYFSRVERGLLPKAEHGPDGHPQPKRPMDHVAPREKTVPRAEQPSTGERQLH